MFPQPPATDQNTQDSHLASIGPSRSAPLSAPTLYSPYDKGTRGTPFLRYPLGSSQMNRSSGSFSSSSSTYTSPALRNFTLPGSPDSHHSQLMDGHSPYYSSSDDSVRGHPLQPPFRVTRLSDSVVEAISGSAGLEPDAAAILKQFNEANAEQRQFILMAYMLRTLQGTEKHQSKVDVIIKDTHKSKTREKIDWKMPDNAVKTMRMHVKWFMARSPSNFSTASADAVALTFFPDYPTDEQVRYASSLGLGEYWTNSNVKAGVSKWLQEDSRVAKSVYREKIFKSVKDKVHLDTFAQDLLRSWSPNSKKAPDVQPMHLWWFAFARAHAVEALNERDEALEQKKQSNKRLNRSDNATHFWANFEPHLASMVDAYGLNVKDSSEWARAGATAVREDHLIFPVAASQLVVSSAPMFHNVSSEDLEPLPDHSSVGADDA